MDDFTFSFSMSLTEDYPATSDHFYRHLEAFFEKRVS